MIAVIKGDIIGSRKLENQENWLLPLKKLFAKWGDTPKNWEIVWGDFFQVEIAHPAEALLKAIEIKALIKKVQPLNDRKKISPIDVRIAVGIGEKTFSAKTISESNGTAFIHAGEQFDALQQENTTLGVKSPWEGFNETMNLYLKLATLFMDKWSVSSAELIQAVLNQPHSTQKEIGVLLGIKQSGVSLRWRRANASEIIAVEKMFRKKLKQQSV